MTPESRPPSGIIPVTLIAAVAIVAIAGIHVASVYRPPPIQLCKSERWINVTDAETGVETLVNMANQSIIVPGEIEKNGKTKVVTKVFSGNVAAGPQGLAYGWFSVSETPEKLVH